MGNPNTALAVAPIDRYRMVASRLEKEHAKLESVLPSYLPVSRFTQVVLNALIRDPKLLQCEINSIVRVAQQSAELGLELGGALGESYIVPFWNKKKQAKIATFIAGYKGLIKLALENPKLELIEAVLVFENDLFKHAKGTSPYITHEPVMGKNKGRVIAAYCRVQYASGANQFEVMDEEELTAIERDVERRLGSTFAYSPWRANRGQHRNEMLRKCPIRKLAKSLSLSAGLKKALEIELTNEGAGTNRVNESLGGERSEALKDKIQGPSTKPSGVADEPVIDAEWEPGDEDESEGR